MKYSILVDVYYRKCSCDTCPNRLTYDGQHDGVFNLSDQSLFTYEAMYSFWDDLTTAPMTYTAHYERMYLAHVHSTLRAHASLLLTLLVLY